MNRKINIIDFETGRSVGITVDEEDMVDTLLYKVKNYWAKQGDYALTFSGDVLAPVCLIKDYHIKDEDILQLRARSSLDDGEKSGLSPRRPEGIVYPESCPKCGPVEFRYISSIEFQCSVCGGVLQKQPEYAPVDPLDRFLGEGESFMDFIPDREEEGSADAPSEALYNYTPPPRIVPVSEPEETDFAWSEPPSEPSPEERRGPRIVGPPKEGDQWDRSVGSGTPPRICEASPGTDGPCELKVPLCEDCGEAMRFIQLYDMWWCDGCEKYLGEERDEEYAKEAREEEAGDHGMDGEAVLVEDEGADGEFPPDLGGKIAVEGEVGMGKELLENRGIGKENAPGRKKGEHGRDPPISEEERARKLERLRELTVLSPVVRGRGGKIEEGGERDEDGRDDEELVELEVLTTTEDADEEFLFRRGRSWLVEYMKMSSPRKTRSRWKDGKLRVEYRDEENRLCLLELDAGGEDIRPLYYRSSSNGSSLFEDDDEL